MPLDPYHCVYSITQYCTTAALQIKGTAQWLYWVNLEYLTGQQIMHLEYGNMDS